MITDSQRQAQSKRSCKTPQILKVSHWLKWFYFISCLHVNELTMSPQTQTVMAAVSR